MSSRTLQAGKKLRSAMRERTIARQYMDEEEPDLQAVQTHLATAHYDEKAADELLRLDKPPETGAGGEVPPFGAYLERHLDDQRLMIARDTLKDPDAAALEASIYRIDTLLEAGIFVPAIDAADSISARNSLEKMLVHQITACHDLALKLAPKVMEHRDTVDQTRTVNAVTKLMRTYQDGMLTLQKLRTGGRQTVVVQHVRVGDGGQAVVAGEVKGRGPAGGGD